MIPRASYAVAVDDVLLLIRTGRARMAIPLLERLPHQITCEITRCMAGAYARGRADLAAEIMGDAQPKWPPTPKRHEWLAARIQNPELRAKAKAALRLDDALLDAIAEGGVGLGSSSWRKLRETLG